MERFIKRCNYILNTYIYIQPIISLNPFNVSVLARLKPTYWFVQEVNPFSTNAPYPEAATKGFLYKKSCS